MIEHVALTHRNGGPGWVLMTTDGRLWEAEAVSNGRRLALMLDEALALLGSHPAADFTFTTRAAHEVWAAPYDAAADLLDVERDLGRSSVSVVVPQGDGRWRLLLKQPGEWFESVDVCRADDVIAFLRDWSVDAETIENGLSGPIEVWLRRRWNAERVLEPVTSRYSGNVTPFPRQQSARP